MDLKLSALAAIAVLVIFAIEYTIFILPLIIQLRRKIESYRDKEYKLQAKFVDETTAIKLKAVEVEKENIELKKHYEEVAEQEKRVMQEINHALEGNPMWGFPEEDAFPGSISVQSSMAKFDSTNDTYGIIHGRVVLPTDVAETLTTMKSNASIAEYTLTYFHKLGILNRVVLQMLRSGCVELTFGYDNEDVVVYYNIQMKRSDNTVVYNLPSEQ